MFTITNLFYCCLVISTVLTAEQRTYELTIQRLQRVMMDTQYIDLGNIRATRINRTHTVVSGKLDIKMDLDDSVMVTIVLYEKSGTDYKRSAAAAYTNKQLCSFINSNAIGAREFKAATNLPENCPVPAGNYEVNNYILDAANFPKHLPGTYWRGDVFLFQEDIQWAHIQVFVKIDQKFPRIG